MTAIKRILRIASWGVLGIVGAATLLYLVALAINWRDVPPSAAARELEEIIARRPPVADPVNGFVYMLGFTAPADKDPQEVGSGRMRWLESHDLAMDPADADPLRESINFMPDATDGARLKNACREDDKLACAREFDALIETWRPSELDALALKRYDALLSRGSWREVVPVHISAPLPAYGSAMHAQRLMFLRLAQAAASTDDSEIRRELAADFTWWKRTQREADNLISKMIAQAALRQHFFCSALVLRQLPAQRIAGAIPQEWHEAFSGEDRAMKRAMAGELIFTKKLMEQYKAGFSPAADDWLGEFWEERFLAAALSPLARRLFQVQDQANYFAGRNLEYARRFEAPMSEYRMTAREMGTERIQREFPVRIYNITGDLLLTLDDGTIDPRYALRTASIEAMRRLALLNVDLHTRAVPPDKRGDEVERSTMRDPYDDQPFVWDAERQSLTFDPPEAHPRFRQELFY
jgi:hypothetical protein